MKFFLPPSGKIVFQIEAATQSGRCSIRREEDKEFPLEEIRFTLFEKQIKDFCY